MYIYTNQYKLDIFKYTHPRQNLLTSILQKHLHIFNLDFKKKKVKSKIIEMKRNKIEGHILHLMSWNSCLYIIEVLQTYLLSSCQ